MLPLGAVARLLLAEPLLRRERLGVAARRNAACRINGVRIGGLSLSRPPQHVQRLPPIEERPYVFIRAGACTYQGKKSRAVDFPSSQGLKVVQTACSSCVLGNKDQILSQYRLLRF